MKFTTLLFAPLVFFATSAAAAPHPDLIIEEKLALLAGLETRDLVERAAVTGTVNANNVRYRRCASTSCEAIGQYHQGRVITITCRVRGESINGWDWWDKMTNGYYISDYYVNWTGGVPDVC